MNENEATFKNREAWLSSLMLGEFLKFVAER